jgi:acetyl/propionyl-CoA carboxylase alpha subunit
MLAKLIAQGPNREQALARMQRYLSACRIFGIRTNQQFLAALLSEPRMQDGELSTRLIRDIGWTQPAPEPVLYLAALIAFSQRMRANGPLQTLRAGFRNLPYRWAQARIEIDETLQELEYHADRTGQLQCRLAGETHRLSAIEASPGQLGFELAQRYYRFELAWQDERLWLFHPELGNVAARYSPLLQAPETAQAQNAYISQMPGKILKILVQPQEAVKLNQALLVIESMKMETQILAHADGVVTGLHVSEGQLIEAGTLCLELE